MSRHLRWARDWPRHPLPRILTILMGLIPLTISGTLVAPLAPPIITVRRPTPLIRHSTRTPHISRHPAVTAAPADSDDSAPPQASAVSPRTTWLAKIVQAEAGDQPFLTQLAVAAVILNRLRSGQFPHHVLSVILQPGQFQPVSNGAFFAAIPTPQALQAAQSMLHGGPNPAPSALYFFNPSLPHSAWMNTLIDCVAYGAMQFCAGPPTA